MHDSTVAQSAMSHRRARTRRYAEAAVLGSAAAIIALAVAPATASAAPRSCVGAPSLGTAVGCGDNDTTDTFGQGEKGGSGGGAFGGNGGSGGVFWDNGAAPDEVPDDNPLLAGQTPQASDGAATGPSVGGGQFVNGGPAAPTPVPLDAAPGFSSFLAPPPVGVFSPWNGPFTVTIVGVPMSR